MAQSLVTETGLAHVDAARASLRLPDADSIAEAALTGALDYSAEKTGVDRQRALLNLQGGDRATCSYCHYSLAKQVAETLGTLDKNIRAVYVMDYDATPEDLCFGATSTTSPIHLIARVVRRTEALDSLVAAVDRALTRAYANTTGLAGLALLLDVQVVDDTDVAKHTGYGALLSSLYHRPIEVWKR